MNINVTKRKAETLTFLQIKDIALVDLTMTFNSGLLSKKKVIMSDKSKKIQWAFEMEMHNV